MLHCFQGDVVAVDRRFDENWLEGQHAGRHGLFPVSYVEFISSPLTPSSAPSSRPTSLTASTGIQLCFAILVQAKHENSSKLHFKSEVLVP